MRKITEILKNSSLSATMSSLEIEEIAEEIKSEIKDYINDEIADVEEERDDLEEEIKDLEKNIEELEEELNTQYKLNINSGLTSLDDIMTAEWARENWEHLIKMQKSNKNLKDVQMNYQSMFNKIDDALLVAINDHDMLVKKMNTDHKRIILCGQGASGKDTARKRFEEKGFKYAVSYTTRPPRSTEVEGVDYYFLSDEQFNKLIDEDKFYEYVSFNGWKYGTSNEQFHNDNIFIMTPYGISKLKPEHRKNSFVIFFNVDETTRRERLNLRSDADTVERRIQADNNDFNNFTDFDLQITNNNF